MLTTLVSGMAPNKFGLFVLLPILFTVASVVITSQLFLFATNYVLSLFKLGFIKIATPIKGPVWATEQRRQSFHLNRRQNIQFQQVRRSVQLVIRLF